MISMSEIRKIRELLKEKCDEYGLSEDCISKDIRQLCFEAIHVLADGIPSRLYDMLHPASSNVSEHDKEANPGKTWLFLEKVGEGLERSCASEMEPF